MIQMTTVNYEIILTTEEAVRGTIKVLSRNNKKLQVDIPAGVTTGSTVKLSNALQITDGRPGNILIEVKVKTQDFTSPTSDPIGVIEINDNNFDVEVLKSNLPAVVDFWAPWCGPCRIMSPIMDKTAISYQGEFKFCKINVDDNPQMASKFQAMSIPMILFFKNGQVVDRSVGAISESALRGKLDSLL